VHRTSPADWPAPVAVAQPRPGDFTCIPVSWPVGLGITVGQWLDGDRFNFYDHAEIYVGRADTACPYGYTVSTYPDGPGKRPLPCDPAKLPGSLWSSGLIDLTGTQRVDIVEWALAHQDTGYSFADYGALVLHRLGMKDPGLRRYIAATRKMICSQYVDAAYRLNDVNLFSDGRWEGYVTPGDLSGLLQGLLAKLRPQAGTVRMMF
jgi:hypothetical protein